jgi:FtsP/CotA-like multicopper oxidase with cupredoxin domain
MTHVTRRQVLVGAASAVGLAALDACSANRIPHAAVGPSSEAVRHAEAARRRAGQRLVTGRLTARPTTLDLGGTEVSTWAYNDALPGPPLRVTAGDLLRVTLDNQLPAPTSIHWHGIALSNDMDGVPGVTQTAVAPGANFTYEFTAPDPGTYFYHPHVGVQLDRGLYGVLLVDAKDEPGRYDQDWTIVLDDWVDGTGRTPDSILASFGTSAGMSGTMGGMAGMGGAPGSSDTPSAGMMGETMTSPVLGGAGDIAYPHYLINGRVPSAPQAFTAKSGQRVRLRLINAGSDTAFRIALASHRLTVTHSDGYPVIPSTTDALIIGMGERYDVEVTLADGVFPLVAVAEGKTGQALAVIRTGAGRAPAATVQPPELHRQVLLGRHLRASEAARLPTKTVDRTHTLRLAGAMSPYLWTINGRTFPQSRPLPIVQGERVRLRFSNQSMMFHPMHLHGHSFAVSGGGPRKDTVIVRPMETLDVEFDATNPGQWVSHCHNIYHAERGMMTTLSYRH